MKTSRPGRKAASRRRYELVVFLEERTCISTSSVAIGPAKVGLEERGRG
jgi:hypothetical protein